MSDQVHKTLLACDGLNRTGQQAPASHGKEIELISMLQSSANPEEAIEIAITSILQVLNFVE